MTDSAAVMKLFASIFEDFLKSSWGITTQVHFLHCNAHFLLAMGSGCDKALLSIEKEADEPLRRDKNERLTQFSKESETATTRLIRLACDFLGPRGDEKSGCHQDWLSFCSSKSFIPSFRFNCFNCFCA